MPSDLPPAPVPRPDVPFAAPRALHPATIVVGVPLLQIIQALLVPTAAALTAGSPLTFALLGMVITVGLVARTLAWHRFRYAFDGEVVSVSRGVISRQHRHVDIARIQQVEIDRPIIHRLLGVSTVRIDTAGSAADVELRVTAHRDAIALRDAIRRNQQRVLGGDIPAATTKPNDPGDRVASAGKLEPVLEVPIRHVVLAAITGRQLLVLPAVIGAAFQFIGGRFADQVGDRIAVVIGWTLRSLSVTSPSPTPPDGSWPLPGTNGAFAAVIVGSVVLAATVVSAAVVGVVRDGGFTLARDGDDLVVRRGWGSTRTSTIPLQRIQLVRIARNPVRRWLGFSAVRMHSAGRAVGADRRIIVPLLRNDRAVQLATWLLNVDALPKLERHPRAARRRRTWRWMRRLGLITVVAAVVRWVVTSDVVETSSPAQFVRSVTTVLANPGVEGLAWMIAGSLLIAALLAMALAAAEYRHLAHGLDDAVVACRRGTVGVATLVAPARRIQQVSVVANWWQRRLGLTSLTAHTAGAGGDLVIPDLDRDLADQHLQRLARLAATAGGASGRSDFHQDRHRTVVDEPDLHVGSEPSRGDVDT